MELKSASDAGKGAWSMRIQPLNDNLVVREIEPEAKTFGGIIIPENAQDKRAIPWGVVVETNSDTISKGDVVIYPRSAPYVFDLGDGKALMVLKEDEILGKVDIDAKEDGAGTEEAGS